MSDLNPVAIILVTSGTRGDRLLFRYPFESEHVQEHLVKSRWNNPYALKIPEDRINSASIKLSASAPLVKNGVLVGFEDKTLANLLAVKIPLCGRKFRVKIDDVRFIGYPVQLEHPRHTPSKKQHSQSATKQHRINTVNLVFALHSPIVESAIDSYHALSKQLIIAFRSEEQRCQYLSTQSKTIRAVFDEVAALPEDSVQNPYKLILQRSQIANEMRQVYTSLTESGVVSLHVNRWVEVNFCLPHKVHVIVTGSKVLHLEPKEVERCLSSLRPYHGLLLMQPEEELLDSLSIDSSPALLRLVKMLSPVKNLQTLSLDADLSLSQVFVLACHLIYWGKAMVIYPLCESNEYILSPVANTLVNSTLAEEFVTQFPGKSLHVELSEFSLPCQLRERQDMLDHPQLQAQRVQMVVWMLQQRLLMQLHTYVFFVPNSRKQGMTLGSMAKTTSIADSSLTNIQVVEESLFTYLMEDHSNLERAPSMSDVASVNSDESVGMPVSSIVGSGMMTSFSKQLSKSPSLEVASDGSQVSEETRAHWQAMQTSFLKELTPTERAAVLKCPASKSPEDLQLFARIFPYFNGKHHIEEIMFYENLHRSQLLTLLDKFKDVLVTCSHQDLSTAFFTR